MQKPNDNFKAYSILYVEDDAGVRAVNMRILSRIFGNTYEASDGLEGLRLYREKKPDIVLTDIKMPKMDGLTLAKKIRETDSTTKIIITTAFSDERYLLDAVELQLERYLIKPLTKRNLLPALQKAISRIDAARKIYISQNFYYDCDTLLFYHDDIVIDMTKKELLFLQLLVENRDKIVSYTQIEQRVWEDEYMSLNSLRTTIGFLRKKLPFNAIANISNMGYKLKIDNNTQD